MGFQSSAPIISATYFTLSDGKCRIRLKEPTSDSVSRVTKDGNTVHELIYDQFTGIIRDIAISETDYGMQWRITFLEAPTFYVCTLKYTSNYAKTIIQALCNPSWDASLETTIKPYAFNPKDDASRIITGATVLQRGQKIERPYCSPLNPVDGKITLPELEKVKIRGVEQWDDTKQMDFLVAEFKKKVLTKLQKPSIMPSNTPPQHQLTEEQHDDTLPF